MNVSMAQVFKAVDYANSHPDKYLNGTTNWCAAVAFDLNRQASMARQPAALGGEVEVVGYGFRNTMVGRNPVMMELRPDVPANDQYGGQLWYPLITQDDHHAHLASRHTEIERLEKVKEAYADSAKGWKQYSDQLKARCDELERLCIDSREAIRVEAVLWPKSTVGQLKPRLDKALLNVAMPASASRVPGCADAAWLLYDSGLYDQHGIHVMPCTTIIGKATAYVGYEPAGSDQA